jgi:hypothetical protein
MILRIIKFGQVSEKVGSLLGLESKQEKTDRKSRFLFPSPCYDSGMPRTRFFATRPTSWITKTQLAMTRIIAHKPQ